jgi:hypothetical protein
MDSSTPCQRYLAIPVGEERVEALCTCGWRSEPVLTAGMAGSLWDGHVAYRWTRPSPPDPWSSDGAGLT